jgi:SAM-dependent methyltransferase
MLFDVITTLILFCGFRDQHPSRLAFSSFDDDAAREGMIPSRQALFEAGRVLKPGGHLIVVEPPESSLFEAFKSIEDEAAVRLEGQLAIRRFPRTRPSPREKCRILAHGNFRQL